ncbi:MAG: Flavin-dependent oxidoreductase, luciferase family [Chloroflexi bacterium]|nr:MAG: Flavin-dependent oxidoreductase, luciferase family [Chloroflexota bacterium]
MQVSISLPRDGTTDWQSTIAYVQEAERLGVTTVWSAEAWGHDGLTPLAFLAGQTSTIKLGTGILQGGTRTPALLGMTCMGMQSVSNGRFLLGFGTSGPQVIEGWHGIPFAGAVSRIRETIEIVRKVVSGERVTYQGRHYTLPLPGGEGKALRTSAQGLAHQPIYVASLGPKSLRMTGELADGWLGTSFVPETADVFLDPMRDGAAAAGRSFDAIDIEAGGAVEFTDDVDEAAARHARGIAFTLGAMGSPTTNFYNDAFVRQGWADEAKAVQRLWVDGKRDEARDRVPVELAMKINCLGTEEMVRDRLRVYRDAGVTTFRAGVDGTIDERIETLGGLMRLVGEINAE